MENIEKFSKIRFNDFTDYDSDKCRNGGAYGFWTEYVRLESGNWEMSYGTTSDIEFCPVCGSFNDHYVGEDSPCESGYLCGEYETATKEEVMELVNNFKETENEYITYEN